MLKIILKEDYNNHENATATGDLKERRFEKKWFKFDNTKDMFPLNKQNMNDVRSIEKCKFKNSILPVKAI